MLTYLHAWKVTKPSPRMPLVYYIVDGTARMECVFIVKFGTRRSEFDGCLSHVLTFTNEKEWKKKKGKDGTSTGQLDIVFTHTCYATVMQVAIVSTEDGLECKRNSRANNGM